MLSALSEPGSAPCALRALTALSASGHEALSKAMPKLQEFVVQRPDIGCKNGASGTFFDRQFQRGSRLHSSPTNRMVSKKERWLDDHVDFLSSLLVLRLLIFPPLSVSEWFGGPSSLFFHQGWRPYCRSFAFSCHSPPTSSELIQSPKHLQTSPM